MTDLSDIISSGHWAVLPPDLDPTETREWLDALETIVETGGPERATFILRKLLDRARALRVPLPPVLNTPYCNTIPLADQPQYPGNLEVESRISALVRWNGLAMVVRANKAAPELGGHIATYASVADLFEVGLNHFFKAGQSGDLVYFQPHAAPGVYARAYLEGRLSEEQLDNYRRETAGKGLSSYCHPWLMPTFWQFPTGSMGLGPITAIYQARFMRYLENRGILAAAGRKVWEFVGDGEMDEPESLAGLSLAAREGLDNLIFVVNCNLQRLDGPVRGNGSIIQELEGLFAGAGWNVIKVLWGSDWDPLFARDREGIILRRLHETVDGEFQKYAATDGRFNREHFFNKYPELQKLVAHLSDEDIDRLHRGGHDAVKIYAAYHAAVNHKGQPTVILAQTKKGYGMGHWGQGKMGAHQQKKLEDEALLAFRDRFALPLSDEDVRDLRFFKPAGDSPEMKYLHQRRQALGGYLPLRTGKAEPLAAPALDSLTKFLEGTHGREQSTTMIFVQLLSQWLRDPVIGKRIVPIVADEARTFGMQALFRQVAIYSSAGQTYEPEDKDELLYYKEAKDGQILEEGITEAGAISSWIAAATSYSAHGVPMLPFYIFYSCFGFQRIGDLLWAAGDSRARGFLLGATAGRTTLSGEGLQHEDGSSHLLFSTVPNCVAYDPAFGYELAVILQDGIRRMLEDQEDVFYYVTVMNENYVQPAMPEGARDGILKGMYKLREAGGGRREAKGTAPSSVSGADADAAEHRTAPSPLAGEGERRTTPSPPAGEGWGEGANRDATEEARGARDTTTQARLGSIGAGRGEGARGITPSPLAGEGRGEGADGDATEEARVARDIAMQAGPASIGAGREEVKNPPSPLAGEGAPERGAGAPLDGDATEEARLARDTATHATPESIGAGWGEGAKVQLLSSGTILREVLAAAKLLEQDWNVAADVWSVTSFTELRREGIEVDRWNRLHPDATPRRTHVEQCLGATDGPVVAATDYMRTVPDLIRPFIPPVRLSPSQGEVARSDRMLSPPSEGVARSAGVLSPPSQGGVARSAGVVSPPSQGGVARSAGVVRAERRYVVLGTDGFGRSDTRERLRSFFEVDRFHVAVAALHALADEGMVDRGLVKQAIAKYGIDPDRPNSWDC